MEGWQNKKEESGKGKKIKEKGKKRRNNLVFPQNLNLMLTWHLNCNFWLDIYNY
jgi:hypothetical protein